ncbi:MAG TPA: hypothetical protein DDW85_06000 [Porphyromonadaceae bacterium]|nr:hypothetical protein [Porphyromonadaceae bacterium]
MGRRIYISIDNVNWAVRDKLHLEALAFNMLIKKSYTSSVLVNASIRRCKDEFKIGTTRMSRIMKNGLSYGLLKRSSNNIIAQKVRDKGCNVTLVFEDRFYSLKEVIKMIQESILLNHVRKQSFLVDAVKKAREPKNSRERVYGRRVLDRMPHIKEAFEGLSNKRIMNITNTKRYTAKKLIKSLVSKGKVLMNHIIVDTEIRPERFSTDAARFDRLNGNVGYLLFDAKRNMIVCQLANSYKYNCDEIRFK